MAERAELDAVARGGSQGRAAYAQAQELIAAQKKAAIGAALAEAAQRGAPAGMQSEISGTVGAPYDRQIGNLAQASASRTAELEQLSAGNANYMSQVSAAGPAMRGALERRVAAKRARSGGGGGGELSDSELSKRLLGAAAVEREQARRVAPIAGGVGAAVGAGVGGAVAGPLGAMLGASVGSVAPRTERTLESRARQLGVGAGIDPNRVYGVVPEPKAPAPTKPAKVSDPIATAAKLSPVHAADLRRNTRYLKAQAMAEDLIGTLNEAGAPFSKKDFIAALGRAPFLAKKPSIRKLIIAEYATQFPGG